MHELKRMRLLDGHTQQTLGKASGVSPTTINRIENETYRPRMDTRRKLLSALECPFDLHRLVFGPLPGQA